MQEVDISVCSHVTHKEKSKHNRGVSILALIVHTEHFMSISSAKKALKCFFFFRFKWNSAKLNLLKTRSFQENRWRNKELKTFSDLKRKNATLNFRCWTVIFTEDCPY